MICFWLKSTHNFPNNSQKYLGS